MSFYNIPTVSYQTQEKLKKKMLDKKKQSRSKSSKTSESSASSSSRPLASPKSSTSSIHQRKLSIMSNGTISSGETALTAHSSLGPADFKAALAPALHARSHDDSRSVHSHRSNNSQYTEHGTRKPSGAMNYTSNADLNEVLEFSKNSKPKSASKTAILGIDSQNNNIKVAMKSYNFPVPGSVPQNGPVPQQQSPSKTPIGTDINELDEQEDQEGHKLTRVYSDVSSIFSTKESLAGAPSTPSSRTSRENSTRDTSSIKSSGKLSRFRLKFTQ